MRDLAEINRLLLKSEFDEAKQIYLKALEQGYSPCQAAIIMYRYGKLDGQQRMKGILQAKVSKAYKQLNLYRFGGLSKPKDLTEVAERSEAILGEMQETTLSLPQTENSGEKLTDNEQRTDEQSND